MLPIYHHNERITPLAIVAATAGCNGTCERARLLDSQAVFEPAAVGDHHRLFQFPLSLGSAGPVLAFDATLTLRADLDGDRCDPEASGRAAECEVVLGLSFPAGNQSRVIWAVGRGLSFGDVLVPFRTGPSNDDGAFRPSIGQFWQTYDETAGVGGNWRGRLQYAASALAAEKLGLQGMDDALLRAKLWSLGPESERASRPAEPPSWITFNRSRAIIGSVGLSPEPWLVAYRDDEPQRYVIHSIDVNMSYVLDHPQNHTDAAGHTCCQGVGWWLMAVALVFGGLVGLVMIVRLRRRCRSGPRPQLRYSEHIAA